MLPISFTFWAVAIIITTASVTGKEEKLNERELLPKKPQDNANDLSSDDDNVAFPIGEQFHRLGLQIEEAYDGITTGVTNNGEYEKLTDDNSIAYRKSEQRAFDAVHLKYLICKDGIFRQAFHRKKVFKGIIYRIDFIINKSKCLDPRTAMSVCQVDVEFNWKHLSGFKVIKCECSKNADFFIKNPVAF